MVVVMAKVKSLVVRVLRGGNDDDGRTCTGQKRDLPTASCAVLTSQNPPKVRT